MISLTSKLEGALLHRARPGVEGEDVLSLNAVVAWILQVVARSASRLWKLCTSRPSSAYIWGTRRCDMAATATQVILDTPAAEFRLPATDGKTYALDDVAGEKGTVVVFICNHCPYVKAVIDRMVSDARVLMSEGVGFAAICSNDAASYPEDSFENMKRFAKAHDFPFPYLHDETQTVARAYGAVCTPDFFGYNADRRLKYRGRLDEGRTTPPRAGAPRELVEAMRAIATTDVGPADQKASVGCSIKWKDA